MFSQSGFGTKLGALHNKGPASIYVYTYMLTSLALIPFQELTYFCLTPSLRGLYVDDLICFSNDVLCFVNDLPCESGLIAT